MSIRNLRFCQFDRPIAMKKRTQSDVNFVCFGVELSVCFNRNQEMWKPNLYYSSKTLAPTTVRRWVSVNVSFGRFTNSLNGNFVNIYFITMKNLKACYRPLKSGFVMTSLTNVFFKINVLLLVIIGSVLVILRCV